MIEYRYAPLTAASPVDANELHLSGYAALFNVESVPLELRGQMIRERIAPGAFSESLKADTQSLYWQHQALMPLASTSSDTLTLVEDERGLRYDAWLPPTQLARDAIALVHAGVVTQMSFSFRARDENFDAKAGTRELRAVQLYEISLVERGAYPLTSVTQIVPDQDRSAPRLMPLSRQHIRLRHLLRSLS